jgi:hypothetical protein
MKTVAAQTDGGYFPGLSAAQLVQEGVLQIVVWFELTWHLVLRAMVSMCCDVYSLQPPFPVFYRKVQCLSWHKGWGATIGFYPTKSAERILFPP